MIYRRPDDEPGPDEGSEGPPPTGPLPLGVGGIVVPLIVFAYGLRCLITGRAVLVGRNIWTPVHGPDAMAIGSACVSIAAFLHCHYGWGNIEPLAAWAVVGKAVGLVGMIASLGYLLIHLGLLGR